ncbi:MAG: chemotaxis protein [Gammaproteobacteria bacterium]|nr:MAG: chemotaxis protein [Gammaproteobacteria bacterium]
MSSFINNLRIKQKLMLILAVVVVSIAVMQAMFLSSLKEELIADIKLSVQSVADVAHGTVKYFHQQQLDGVLTEDQAKQAAITALKGVRYGTDQYIWINDTSPVMVMHPVEPELIGKNLAGVKDANGKAIFVEMVNVVKPTGAGFVEYQWIRPGGDQAIDKISYVEKFDPWGWIIGTGVYVDDVDAAYTQVVVHSLLLFGGTLLVMLAVVLLMSNSIVSQVSTLQAVMDKVAHSKDLTQRVPHVGDNELGVMADSFNEMLAAFEISVNDVLQSVEQLASASEELSVISSQTSEGVTRQHQEIDVIASAMEEMSVSVKEVSGSIEGAGAATEYAQNEAEKGHQVVDDTRSSINGLAEEVERASQVIHGLEKDCENIGTILDVIRGIAEQTNLLALNAAIEAARAGEQGRGFAVVADEVRTLAKRTQDSIEEIEAMIERLQSCSKNAVSVMDVGRKKAKVGVEQISDVAESLNLINDTVSTINSTRAAIAVIASQQASVANEMSSNIINVSGVAETTSQGAQQTSVACADLARLAEELSGITHRFKVS